MKLLLWLLVGFTLSFGAVDINSADKEELMSIKGVGEKKAELIMKYRATHKCFKNVDEIKEVKGFGDKFLAKNRVNLSAGGCKK